MIHFKYVCEKGKVKVHVKFWPTKTMSPINTAYLTFYLIFPANPIILLTRYFRLYLVTCQFPEAATNEDEIEDALLKYRNINVATRKQLLYSKWTILTYIPPSSISGITNFVMAIQMSQFKENIVGNSFTWHKNLWYVTNTI